jgi:hypothetical protein
MTQTESPPPLVLLRIELTRIVPTPLGVGVIEDVPRASAGQSATAAA